MPLMIKRNRNIMKVDLCLNNGHFITVIYIQQILLIVKLNIGKCIIFIEYNKLLDIIMNEKNF